MPKCSTILEKIIDKCKGRFLYSLKKETQETILNALSIQQAYSLSQGLFVSAATHLSRWATINRDLLARVGKRKLLAALEDVEQTVASCQGGCSTRWKICYFALALSVPHSAMVTLNKLILFPTYHEFYTATCNAILSRWPHAKVHVRTFSKPFPFYIMLEDFHLDFGMPTLERVFVTATFSESEAFPDAPFVIYAGARQYARELELRWYVDEGWTITAEAEPWRRYLKDFPEAFSFQEGIQQLLELLSLFEAECLIATTTLAVREIN